MDTFLIPILTWILLMPFIVTLLFYKYVRKYMWCVPMIALITMGVMFLHDVMSITNERTLNDKLNLYFHNDWCLNFYLLYMPMVISSIVFTFIFYLIIFLKWRKKNKYEHRQ